MDVRFLCKSSRQKFSQGLPAALIRFLSDTGPFDTALIAARESDRNVIEMFVGRALITQEIAATSGMKLFPSDRTFIPPLHRTLCCWSVITTPQPEFEFFDLVSVEPSV